MHEPRPYSIALVIFGTSTNVGLSFAKNLILFVSTTSSLSTSFAYLRNVFSATSICPLTHSSNITGFTKVCNYPNAIGGPKAITVSSTAICPIKYN